jgi:integrase
MARYRSKQFGLVSRPVKYATVWYYYHYLDGNRSGIISTGIGYTNIKDRVKTRREAERYCEDLLAAGILGKKDTSQTLEDFIQSMNFWDWHRSDYIRGILARTEDGKAGITQSYVNTAYQITRDHILPSHGKRKLERITPQALEDLLFTWAKSASHKSANNWRSVYSVILGEAERLGLIKENPWKKTPPLKPKKNARGGLTIQEVIKILSVRDLSGPRYQYFLAAKIAFLTGLRIGEIRGLYTADVIDIQYNSQVMSYLSITKQHNSHGNEITPTKDKDTRQVPITQELRIELEPLLKNKGYLLSNHPRQETALPENRIRIWFYNRLVDAGVTDRKERNITFHSTRRFFNTLLRQSGTPDDMIRRFTGHDSVSMTDHYTDYLPQDLLAITEAQKKLQFN